MPFFAIVLFLLLVGFPVSNAKAEASLEQAVDLWLSGDDAQSLPMLAELARSGDADARLLLGRIETSDLGPSPFRLSLSPEDSRALFRRKPRLGQRFGNTWIAVEAAAGNDHAVALAKSVRPDPDPSVIAKLRRLGEYQAADYPTRIVALYGDAAMKAQLLTSSDLMEDLEPYLAYLSGPPEPRGDGLAALRRIVPDQASAVSANDPDTLGMAGLLALGFGYGDINASNQWRQAVEAWLLTARSTLPVADLCTEQCKEEAGGCAFAFLALAGGYFEIIRIDSPLEKVIPQDRFLTSPRARQMLLRRVTLARAETNLTWLAKPAQVAPMSQCVADLIAQERLGYEE